MQFNEKVVEVFLLGNSIVPVRAWVQPSGEVVENFVVSANSRGILTPAIGAIEWSIWYGGYWSVGTPFISTATHIGGQLINNGSFALNAEVAEIIHNNTALKPTNQKKSFMSGGNHIKCGYGGFPLVAQFINRSAFDFRLAVTFITKSVSIP